MPNIFLAALLTAFLINILKKRLIIIQGPTAIGKTTIAIELAKKVGTSVVSADSRQVFNEMKIGTARPGNDEMEGVKHYLIGHKSINDSYNANVFSNEARNSLEEIYAKNDVAIICGGSGFYIKALLESLDDMPEIPEKIRQELNKELKESGLGALQKELKEKDSSYSSIVDMKNPQRLIRALEVIRYTGKTFSEFRNASKKALPYEIFNFALTKERASIYDSINTRVDKMIKCGLEEEVRSLLPYRKLNALQTVGYNEFFQYFDGIISFENCVEQIKMNTRRFAKRQLAWLRREDNMIWIYLDKEKDVVDKIYKQQWPG